MKTMKFLLVIAVGFLFAVSCDNDNGESPKPNPVEYDLDITGDTDFDPQDFKGNIKANVTLKKGVNYLMTGKVYVESGFTLTIEPGTTVKCESGRTDVFLAVRRGAKINAQGTETSPILFTSDAKAPKPGDWGGILLAGNAKNNKGSDAEAEVAGLKYGGSDDNDNSGVLSYVIAEYTGAKINGAQEFNGITFYSVGKGTTINNIVVKNGADDGVEFFGGNVNVQNILCVNIKDDMFDFTDGFSGELDNLFGVREQNFTDATEDPRGIEGDSNGKNNEAQPISMPTLKNVTILNACSKQELKAGAEIRRGAKVTIANALFAAYGNAEFGNLIDTKDDKGNGELTISGAYKFGNVGSVKEGGTITGSVEESTDAISLDGGVLKVKDGIGADFSKFSWTKYNVKYTAEQ